MYIIGKPNDIINEVTWDLLLSLPDNQTNKRFEFQMFCLQQTNQRTESCFQREDVEKRVIRPAPPKVMRPPPPTPTKEEKQFPETHAPDTSPPAAGASIGKSSAFLIMQEKYIMNIFTYSLLASVFRLKLCPEFENKIRDSE